MEEWRQLKDFPLYSVSNIGNIKHNKTNRLRKLYIDLYGYISIQILNIENKKVTKKVHRLVADTFLNNPDNKKTVNHKNHIKHDNRVINLEWATMKEQNIHKHQIPLTTGGKRVIQYDLNMNYINTFNSIREAGRYIGNENTSSSCISKVCLEKLKTYNGFIWKYEMSNKIDNEIWKKITINNHTFNISNKGRVMTTKNVISYGSKDTSGYRRVASKYFKISVHRLVAIAFLDKPNVNNNIVNHKDGIKDNNCVENLEWVTNQENAKHAIDILKVGMQKAVIQIDPNTLQIIKEFPNIRIASSETCTNDTSISHVCSGKYKTANGFIWKFK